VLRWLLAVFLLLAGVAPALAGGKGVADPVAATQALYGAMLSGNIDNPGELPFTARLDALAALDAKEFGPDEVGRLDFDIYLNGQDGKVSDVSVSARDVDNAPNRRIVVVTFRNFDTPMETHFFWEKGRDGLWRVDDVRALGEDGWTLSLLYKYGWDGSEAQMKSLQDAASAP
jgi:hypothetical protein